MPTVAVAPLTTFVRDIFVAYGVPAGKAEIVARSLVLANLKGHDSHGVIRVIEYVAGDKLLTLCVQNSVETIVGRIGEARGD